MENTKKILTVLGLLLVVTYSWGEPAFRKVGKPDVRVEVEHDVGVGTADVRKLTREIHRSMIKGNEQHLRDVFEFAFFLSGQDIKQKVGLTDDQAAFILKIYELNPFVERTNPSRDDGAGGSDIEFDPSGQREIDALRELQQDDVLHSFEAEIESALGNLIQKMINQYYHNGSWYDDLEPTQADNPDEPIYSQLTDKDTLDKDSFIKRLRRLKSFILYGFVREYLVGRIVWMINLLDSSLKGDHDVDIRDEDLKREVYEYLDVIVLQLEGKKEGEMQEERDTINFIIDRLNPTQDQYEKYEPYFTFWSDDE